MAKKFPLSVRIYYDPPLTELVRLIKYDTLPLENARDRLAPLAERYGRDAMNRAAKQALDMDEHEVRLTPEVRKAAWQLLGPPPAEAPTAGAESASREMQPEIA